MRISSRTLSFAVVGLGLLLTGVPAMAAGETEPMQGTPPAATSACQPGAMGAEGTTTTTHKKHHKRHSSHHRHHKSHKSTAHNGSGMSSGGGMNNGGGMNGGATETAPATK